MIRFSRDYRDPHAGRRPGAAAHEAFRRFLDTGMRPRGAARLLRALDRAARRVFTASDERLRRRVERLLEDLCE